MRLDSDDNKLNSNGDTTNMKKNYVHTAMRDERFNINHDQSITRSGL